MSQKQLAFPQTMQQATRQSRLSQNAFTGMNVDDEACNVSASEVVKLVNLLAFGNELDGRTGCEKLMDIALPARRDTSPDIAGDYPETSFEASKSGYDVTVIGGGMLALITVGDYFRWSDGVLDQVTALTGTGFTSFLSETRTVDANCKLILQPQGAYYHDKAKKIYLQLGTELWVISTQGFAAYSKVPFVGKASEGLGRSQSRFRPSDEDVIIFNANGEYRIINERPFNHYFQINADNPSQAFTEVEQTEILTFGRQAIYSLSRIVGGNFNDGRLGAGNLLLQESSPVSPDPTTRRDTAKVFTALPVGLGSELTYRLISKDDSTDHVSTNTAVWAAYAGAYGFKVKFNGRLANIRPDFTGLTGVGYSMFDIANAIQIALRVEFPKATCTYYVSTLGNPVLEITPGENGTIEEPDSTTYPAEAVIPPDAGSNLTNVGGAPANALWMNYSGSTIHALTTAQAKAPVVYDAALVPEDGAAFTHITLWETTDNGPAGIILNNKTEKLIWSKDVPIIRPFNALLRTDAGKMSGAVFYQADVGSTFRFYNGFEAKLSYITDSVEGNAVWTETANYAKADDWSTEEPISGPCAFGANKVCRASQEGNLITLNENYIGEFGQNLFSESDVGKIIFVANGGLRTITQVRMASVFSPGLDQAVVIETGNFTAQAIGWDYNKKSLTTPYPTISNRSILSNVTDKILVQRGKDDDFVLQTRYYEPLPSSLIGEIVNNFLCVAPDNSTTMYYCSVPLGKKWRLGYHHPGWQKDDNTEDIITYIKRYADRIICFCRRSTYGTSTATISSLDEPDIGEKIFLLPHLSLVDNIGLVHTGSLQDIGIGQSIMITHEPAVRAFDGRQFGTKDLSAGAVYTYISTLARIVFSSYDPVGGYRIYGTLQETELYANRINPETGICLQLALDADQGNGWSIQGGPKMVMPMPMTEGMLIQNAKGYLIQAMLDERTGKFFNISTYEGPEGSDLEEVWTDKDDTEIQCQVIMREDKGNPESEQLEFLASHIYLRPDPSSVDDDGNPKYRTGQEVLCRIYNDGRVIYTAQTLNIPIPGDVSFDRKSQGPRIQVEFILATSQVIIIGIDRIYATRDRAGNQALASRNTTEIDHQREYAQQILWLSRGRQPTLNRSIGNVAGGGAIVRVPGPDGQATSAFQLADPEIPVEVQTHQDLAEAFTIQFGYKR